MVRHGVPTAQHRSFESLDEAQAYVQSLTPPIVVKDAALKAGKGVTIAQTHSFAQSALNDIFSEPGAKVVIEDFMTGQEVSILALTDGERYALTPPSQDHKTIFENDTGPMTGGMGVIGAETTRKFVKEGHKPVVFARHRDDSLVGDILDKIDFEQGDVLDIVLGGGAGSVAEADVSGASASLPVTSVVHSPANCGIALAVSPERRCAKAARSRQSSRSNIMSTRPRMRMGSPVRRSSSPDPRNARPRFSRGRWRFRPAERRGTCAPPDDCGAPWDRPDKTRGRCAR